MVKVQPFGPKWAYSVRFLKMCSTEGDPVGEEGPVEPRGISKYRTDESGIAIKVCVAEPNRPHKLGTVEARVALEFCPIHPDTFVSYLITQLIPVGQVFKDLCEQTR